MESIEVTARFDLDGKITPLRFVWRGQSYQVSATGRQWQQAGEWHVLVMVPGEQVYELVFDPGQRCWYMARSPTERWPA